MWVAVAETEADRQGVPLLEKLVAVDAETGDIGEELAPEGQLHVTGQAGNGSVVWIADVVGGTLVRVG